VPKAYPHATNAWSNGGCRRVSLESNSENANRCVSKARRQAHQHTTFMLHNSWQRLWRSRPSRACVAPTSSQASDPQLLCTPNQAALKELLRSGRCFCYFQDKEGGSDHFEVKTKKLCGSKRNPWRDSACLRSVEPYISSSVSNALEESVARPISTG